MESYIIEYGVLIVVELILLVMAIPLLMGKGAFLIAGYNTASKEEQRKYDEKKLCKATGTVLLLCDILMVLQACTLISSTITITMLFVATVILLIYGNIGCKKK